MGCVLQGGAGMNVARQAALKAGVPKRSRARPSIACAARDCRLLFTVSRPCRPVHRPCRCWRHGIDVERALPEGCRWGYRMGHAEVTDSILAEGLTCAIEGCHMGITAETIVDRYGVSLADQDASRPRVRPCREGDRERRLQAKSSPSRSRRRRARRPASTPTSIPRQARPSRHSPV